MVSVVSVFPLLHPCAIRFPGSKTQKSSLTCFQWPIFSPCWTHVYAFTVPSFSLVAPCCTHVSFRFSVFKNRKVLSHMRSVAHLLFAFRSAHVPLKFSGPKPIFESKTREHRVFSNMFFQPFLFKSFSCKQERPIWNSSSYISNFSLFRCASPVCFASLLFPPGVTEHRWNWSGPLSCRAAVIHPKITTAQKESEVPVLHPVIPEAQKNWHEIHETGPLHGMYTLQSQHMCYVNIPQISPKSYLMCPKPSLYHWKPWTEVSFIWLIEPHVMR